MARLMSVLIFQQKKIQDSGFWVQFWVLGFRIQVFGSGFGLFDSGFKFLAPVFGFPIQDSGLWVGF